MRAVSLPDGAGPGSDGARAGARSVSPGGDAARSRTRASAAASVGLGAAEAAPREAVPPSPSSRLPAALRADAPLRPLTFAINAAVLAAVAGAAALHGLSTAGAATLEAATVAADVAAAVAAAGGTAAAAAPWPAQVASVLGTETLAAAGAAWTAYASALAAHPLAVPAAISGVTYGLGDATAQAAEGRSVSDFDPARALRSALVGAALHGPLAATFYTALDRAIILSPFFGGGDAWYAPLACLALDQTMFAFSWNALHATALGLLAGAHPKTVLAALLPVAAAGTRGGWRLWPAVGAVTFTLVPAPHRLLFVDAADLAWVTLLAAYAAQKRGGGEGGGA